jgi:hypothetical protein
MPRLFRLALPLLCLTPICVHAAPAAAGQNPAGTNPAPASRDQAGGNSGSSGTAAAPAGRDPVTASRNAVAPGQAVTLTWNFSGTKIVISGGRFGAGTNVTQRRSVVDHPAKTTRYGFDLWYRAAARPGAKSAPRREHVHYSLLVSVVAIPKLALYHDPRGWEIKHIAGWQTDVVATAAGGPRGLTYFQPEDDAVERLVVAVLPMKGATCSELVEKIRADIPSHYEDMTIVSQTECIYEGVPAVETCFMGVDPAHPGTRTTALFLALVQADQAYVITARTATANFKARQFLMEQMLKSFHIGHASARSRFDLSMARHARLRPAS